ncbi:MAG: Gfo/Idh/MocA family oxidoreductase [Clostridia bacterium]|nr:Gfo/Idh/MocA family oxidoreductase [Clostridia bacterium]
MKEKIRVGYVGLGRRGCGVLKANFALMPDVDLVYMCDLIPERAQKGCAIVQELGGYSPKAISDYHEILADDSIDALIIMTCWSGRPQIAMDAMKAGKYAAIEVGCADSLQECFDLVRVSEETGKPCMMLENCCYARREMMVLNMVKQGLFGEIVHCAGGYMHYLPEEDLYRHILREEGHPHYRIDHYIRQNRENYPTHEFGPLSKILGINRGNRILTLSSFASKARALKQYCKDHMEDPALAEIDYKQGDIVTTVMTCANGETVVLTLDTTAPRPYYSRNFTVRGTLGMSFEDTKVVYLDGMEHRVRDNEEQFFEKYDHPLYKEYTAMQSRGGHGGIDWLVCRAFVEAVKNGTQTPIDVYDTAAWLAIGPLSEASIQQGGAPQQFPDFTNGRWNDREPLVKGKYCLDEVVEDKSVPIY